MATQTAEKLPWVVTPATHSFARFPEAADYAAPIAEYRRGGAPPA